MARAVIPKDLIARPTILESAASLDIFADGGVVETVGNEVVQIVMYACRQIGDGIEHLEVARIHMPRSGFERSMVRTVTEMMPFGVTH